MNKPYNTSPLKGKTLVGNWYEDQVWVHFQIEPNFVARDRRHKRSRPQCHFFRERTALSKFCFLLTSGLRPGEAQSSSCDPQEKWYRQTPTSDRRKPLEKGSPRGRRRDTRDLEGDKQLALKPFHKNYFAARSQRKKNLQPQKHPHPYIPPGAENGPAHNSKGLFHHRRTPPLGEKEGTGFDST